MASIGINLVPPEKLQVSQITGSEKLLAINQNGIKSTIKVNKLLDKVDETVTDKIESIVEDLEGFSYELPEATADTLGGIKLGICYNDNCAPLVNINEKNGSGVGINIDSGYFTQLNSYDLLRIRLNESMSLFNGIGVNLGTNGSFQDVIPCVLGSDITDSSKYGINKVAVGIPYNSKQFCLNDNGLNLVDGIGSGVTKVTWNSSSNMNDFKTPGVYEIYGERTVKTDNLPIANDGSGHSISARLTVVASTLQPANNEICVTQFLMLSNRVDGDGNMYVRTYNQNNGGVTDGVWSPWQKQMGLVETLINSNETTVGQEIFTGTAEKIGNGLNGMIDNGMYSGIYIDNLNYTGTQSLYYLSAQPTFVETFVLIVINDYAASGKLNLPRHITQLKYAVDAITGQSTVKKRVGTGSGAISWGDWEEIGSGGTQEVDVTDIVKTNGLSYLVVQGSAQEGITYVINFLNSDLNNKKINLDSGGKLADFFKDKYASSPGGGCIKLNYKVLKGSPDYNNSDTKTIEGVFYSDDAKYNFYIIYGGEQSRESCIKISQDMAVL